MVKSGIIFAKSSIMDVWDIVLKTSPNLPKSLDLNLLG